MPVYDVLEEHDPHFPSGESADEDAFAALVKIIARVLPSSGRWPLDVSRWQGFHAPSQS